jgi:hypothetical protein
VKSAEVSAGWRRTGREEPHNMSLQRTNTSVASLRRLFAAERQYR